MRALLRMSAARAAPGWLLLPGLLLGLWAGLAHAQPAAAGAPPAAPQAPPSFTPPQAHCPAPPVYPRSELAARRAGQVVLHLRLDAQGQVQETTVARGMGEAFDAAAREAVAPCTFTPGLQDGTPVATVIEFTLEFVPPAPRTRLTGQVVGEGGEALAGAVVSAAGVSAVTDAQGHFQLELALPERPEGQEPAEVQVRVEREGHAPQVLTEPLRPGVDRQVRVALAREQGLETRVVGSRQLPDPPVVDRTPQVSRFTISAADIDRTPGALEDISRVVATLPGVAADPDLLATLFVRGGGPNEVLFFLEGVPLANPFHLGGFATLFNPMMLESADFYAGSAPGRYEPALSGVLDVRYARPEASTPRVWADVSLNSAKLRVDTPTGIEGLSVSLAGRRSYFELYFAGLRALGVVGSNYVAPDIGEYMARVNYRRGAHTVTATFLEASDGFSFLVAPGEQVLVDFAGGLTLSNRVRLGILQERLELGGESELSVTLALMRDASSSSVRGETTVAQETRQDQVFGRADLLWVHAERSRSRVGVQFSRRDLRFEGQLPDLRAQAPWAALPFVSADTGHLDLRPRILRDTLAGYVEHRHQPSAATTLDGSARLQVDVSSGQPTWSLHAAASHVLPTATVLKASAGMATQLQASPLLLDPVHGNPALAPERALHLIAGVEQPLPFQALLRLEGYGKWLSSLAVNPDSRAGLDALLAQGQPVFQSRGTGFARGVDLLLLGRTERLSYGGAVGLVFSDRFNPLASGPQRYRAPWDQRLTASANLSYAPDRHWLLTGRVSFHTGRPFTPVEGFVPDGARTRFLPVFGATNSDTYPPFLEGSARVERRFRMGPLRAAWYAEVLNVTNARNVFAYMYDDGTPATGELPERAAFHHLPIRPFLGIRAEY